jgi:hypothetical protein
LETGELLEEEFVGNMKPYLDSAHQVDLIDVIVLNLRVESITTLSIGSASDPDLNDHNSPDRNPVCRGGRESERQTSFPNCSSGGNRMAIQICEQLPKRRMSMTVAGKLTHCATVQVNDSSHIVDPNVNLHGTSQNLRFLSRHTIKSTMEFMAVCA